MFREFCYEREIKEGTIKLYKFSLQKYVDFLGMTLEELIKEAEEEQRDPTILNRERKIRQHFIDFKTFLNEYRIEKGRSKGNPYSDSTKREIMTFVTSFYNHFDVDTPKPKNRKSTAYKKQMRTIDDLPTMEEIQEIMDLSSTNYKAVITLGLSSGMGASEIASLTFKHFYDAIGLKNYPKDIPDLLEKVGEKDNIVALWKIIRIKTAKPYFTFSSPENVDLILKYLKELHIQHPEYIPQIEDKLMRSIKYNKELNAQAIPVMYNHLNDKTDLRLVNGKNVVRSHTMRKYFASTLQKNKMSYMNSKWLLGHDVPSVDASYFFAHIESIRADYVEILDQLTTNKVQIKVIDKYEELSNRLDVIEKHPSIIESGTLPESVAEELAKREMHDQIKLEEMLKNMTEKEISELIRKSEQE